MSEADQGQAAVVDAGPDELEADASPMSLPGAQPTVRLSVAILVVIAAVVVGLLAVTAVIKLDADRLPAGPPRDPPTPEAGSQSMAISLTRVNYQELSLSLPEENPFICSGDEPSPTPLFSQYTSCTATVHKGYVADGSSWVAQVGVALLADSTGTPGDLPGTTQAVFDAVIGYSYQPRDHMTLSKQVSEAYPDVPAPAGKVWIEQANANVSVKDLPTPYDRVTVILVELASGRRVAYIADIPTDSPKALTDSLVTSIGSISAES